MALPNIILYLKIGKAIDLCFLLMFYYIMAFLITLLINLTGRVAKIIRPILFFIITVISLANIYCVVFHENLLSYDVVQTLLVTYPKEVKEYYDTYVTTKVLLGAIIAGSILIGLSVFFVKSRGYRNKRIWITGYFILLVSITGLAVNYDFLKMELSGRDYWHFAIADIVDLREYSTNPLILESDTVHPSNLVIVIGESFSRNHSSLYGYDKTTNPLLKGKEDAGEIIVFHNVEAPAVHTTTVFKYLLNTNLINLEENKKWYRYTNLIEILNNLGYKTSWLSNQAKSGIYDNLPGSHAKLCERMVFLSDSSLSGYDGNLIDLYIADSTRNNAIFYHLMGQHVEFKKRYPKEFKVFTEKDYSLYPDNQRNILAAYDNATLYNDFVVNALMDLYKDDDAILFYFPDHGLDLFDSDKNYFGHAKINEKSQKAAKQIPFIVYVSPIFQSKYPEKVVAMRNNVDKFYSTDKLIFSIMDILGYEFAENKDVEKFSLFN